MKTTLFFVTAILVASCFNSTIHSQTLSEGIRPLTVVVKSHYDGDMTFSINDRLNEDEMTLLRSALNETAVVHLASVNPAEVRVIPNLAYTRQKVALTLTNLIRHHAGYSGALMIKLGDYLDDPLSIRVGTQQDRRAQ